MPRWSEELKQKALTIAIGATLREVAEQTGVPEGTIKRWRSEARAAAVSPEIEAGNVYIPDPSIAPWIGDFVEECTAFPNGAHDDQVDAMTQALLRFQNQPTVPTVGARVIG